MTIKKEKILRAKERLLLPTNFGGQYRKLRTTTSQHLCFWSGYKSTIKNIFKVIGSVRLWSSKETNILPATPTRKKAKKQSRSGDGQVFDGPAEQKHFEGPITPLGLGSVLRLLKRKAETKKNK